MKLSEIQLLFTAIQGASDNLHLKVASAMYAIERARQEPINEQQFKQMWAEATNNRMPIESQARLFLQLIEAHYGIDTKDSTNG